MLFRSLVLVAGMIWYAMKTRSPGPKQRFNKGATEGVDDWLNPELPAAAPESPSTATFEITPNATPSATPQGSANE